MNSTNIALTCPSAQPDMEDAQIVGVISGDPETPRIAYLERDIAIDLSVASQLGELNANEVFRIAAKCETSRCCHFDGSHCALAKRIVEQLPQVVEILPRCKIRPTCRWFAEQGAAACRRCPQIVTLIPREDNALNRAAMPQAGRP